MMGMMTSGGLGEMKRLLFLLLFLLFLSGCAEQQEATRLMNTQRALVTETQRAAHTQEAARQFTAAYQAAESTSVALNLRSLHAEGTLQAAAQTADVYRSYQTATAQYQAAVATAQAQFLAASQTARAEMQTEVSAQTATQQAWVIGGWTATAQAAQATTTAEASATQQRWTQQAIDRQATADQAYVMAISTAQAAQAGLADEALARERSTRTLIALAPFALGTVLVLLLSLALTSWARLRVVQRDVNGVAPVIVLDGRVVNPDRSVTPVVDPHQAQLAPGAMAQLRVTENEQKVQAVRALVTSKPHQAQSVARHMTERSQTGRADLTVQVIPAREARQWVNDVAPAVYREAIEEEDGHER